MDISKLIPIMADLHTVEELVERIANSASEYKSNPSEEILRHLEMDCTLLCTKRAIALTGGVDVFTKELQHSNDLRETDKMLRNIPGVSLTGDNPSPN